MKGLAAAVVALCLVATNAQANADRKESCKITAGIVKAAIDARLAGRSAKQVKTYLATPEAGIADTYKPTIPPLVDMVYGLSQDGLNKDTAKNFEKQCRQY